MQNLEFEKDWCEPKDRLEDEEFPKVKKCGTSSIRELYSKMNDKEKKEFEIHIQKMVTSDNPNITINSTEPLEETQHILLSDK